MVDSGQHDHGQSRTVYRVAGPAGAQPGRLACGQDGGRTCSSVCGGTSAHRTRAGGSLVEEEPLLGFPSLGALGTPPVGLNLVLNVEGLVWV